jgi:hypothetical protein
MPDIGENPGSGKKLWTLDLVRHMLRPLAASFRADQCSTAEPVGYLSPDKERTMSLARKIVVPALALTAMFTTASIAGGANAWANITGTGFGSGSTATAAENAAKRDLVGNFHGCKQPAQLVYDTESHGVWNAEVNSSCEWAN